MKISPISRFVCLVALLSAASLSGSQNDHTVVTLGLTKFVQPMFPATALLDGVTGGEVALAIRRDAAGAPTEILVLNATHFTLADAAVDAAQQWRFGPVDDDTLRKLSPALVRVRFESPELVYLFPKMDNRLHTSSFDETRGPVVVPPLQSLKHTPKAISQAMPAYPARLASKKIPGEVSVVFYIDEDGKVRMPRLVSETAAEFGDAALAAVSTWRYEVPRVKGQPSVVSESWTFQFKSNG